jgi:hypothetical protein
VEKNREKIMPGPKIADLSNDQIEAIQALESKLGDGVCLVAVEKGDISYILEAKVAPKAWERVDKVYPEIENLCAFYSKEENARLAKSSLKSLLLGKFKGTLKKRPVRIRKLE